MDWKTVSAGLFGFGWSCIFVSVAKTLTDMRKSVDYLNIQIAIVIEKVGNHEKRIERLEIKGNE